MLLERLNDNSSREYRCQVKISRKLQLNIVFLFRIFGRRTHRTFNIPNQHRWHRKTFSSSLYPSQNRFSNRLFPRKSIFSTNFF